MAPVSTLNPIPKPEEIPLAEAPLLKLGPALARVAAETAGAFFMADAVIGSDWTVIPRLPDLGLLRCSQKNIGEKHEMVLNLAVEKSEWDRLFTGGEAEDFRMDAFCEMANCICGGLIAETAFTDAYGYLIPCVPYGGHAKPPAGARTYRAAFRLGGAWIHFSVTVHEATGILAPAKMMVA